MVTLAHKPGDAVEVFENGRWVPAVIMRVASYAGRAGPGYYARHDRCAEFWTNDRLSRKPA